MTNYTSHDIESWAKVRDTSIEIANAIFEFAKGDEVLAQKIWDNGNDEVLFLAFTQTDKEQLFWGEQVINRKDV